MRLPSIKDIFGHDFKSESVKLNDSSLLCGLGPESFKDFKDFKAVPQEPVDGTLRLSNYLVFHGNHYNPHVCCEPCAYHDILREYYAREKEIYGDQHDELMNHEPDDPRVNELLIQDALRTGYWRELPKSLQAEYHKRLNKS